MGLWMGRSRNRLLAFLNCQIKIQSSPLPPSLQGRVTRRARVMLSVFLMGERVLFHESSFLGPSRPGFLLATRLRQTLNQGWGAEPFTRPLFAANTGAPQCGLLPAAEAAKSHATA